jgi:lactoylglutathione lyase
VHTGVVHIEHVALWTADLERLRTFYERYFAAQAGPLYVNPAKGFQSNFLRFASGARLELMQKPTVRRDPSDRVDTRAGFVHLAFVVGDEAAVDALTRRLRADGYPAIDGPRRTGDGYYECVVKDPDGNLVEICAGGESSAGTRQSSTV